MEETAGQGWPTVCVSLRSCTDYRLTTPWTHLVVLPCSRGKITTTDLKMTHGWSFMRCGESVEKKTKTNWSVTNSESRKATKQTQLSQSKQHRHQLNTNFKIVLWKETPCSWFIDLGQLTVQKLLKIVNKELSQRRSFWPLQSIKQLLDFGGDATVDCNTYTIRLEDMTR